MNFSFSVSGLVKGRRVTISVWDRKACVRLSAEERERMREIIDTFGWNSAQAQGLSRPITDYNRIKSGDQRLYLISKPHWVRGTRVIGGLQCGTKHLYFNNHEQVDGLGECEPLCVLDFYIHERSQRKGIGQRLFRAFLESESAYPDTIAYYRPSAKLIGFLRKHYAHTQIPSPSKPSVQQNNNFAVLGTFFNKVQLTQVETNHKRTASASGIRFSAAFSKQQQTVPATSQASSSLPGTPIRTKKQSSTTVSSSIISRYSGYQKQSRTSGTSVDSTGKVKEPFSQAKSRPPLQTTSSTLRHRTRENSTTTVVQHAGPYPGWQPPDKVSRIQRRKRNDSVGLTRLAPMHTMTKQEPRTPASRCTPPWATGLSADRKTGLVKRVVTTSAILSYDQASSHQATRMEYSKYRGRCIEAMGAKNCLHWTQ